MTSSLAHVTCMFLPHPGAQKLQLTLGPGSGKLNGGGPLLWTWSLEAIELPSEADTITKPRAGEEKETWSRLAFGESRLTLTDSQV